LTPSPATGPIVVQKVKERPRGRIRTWTARTLDRVGLLERVRGLRRRLAVENDAEILRREQERRERFPAFRDQYEAILSYPGARNGSRSALLVGRGILEAELAFIKALQVAGFEPVVLYREDQRALRSYYELAGVRRFHTWNDLSVSPALYEAEAARAVKRCSSIADLVQFYRDGIRVGRIAASTTIRDLRVGTLPLDDPDMREKVTARVGESLAAVVQAERILKAVRPDLAIFWDTEYTPKGELFDACLARGIDVVAYGAAHNKNGLMFKRYSADSQNHHLASLSEATWARLRQLSWTATRRRRLDEELMGGYARGDWFRKAWTQADRQVVPADEVRASLGLDPAKPTAIIFPNILSDTPLLWARTLFPTYEDWLIDTVRVACQNDRVNWVVKIHPANVGRRLKDKFHGDPPELRALERRLGALPPHVVVVPPEVPITTSSFYDVMDYCVTVRGTVGIEAARVGVPVLTAAACRYSHRGFTIDSESREEFLERVSRIEHTPPMSAAQRELAERFAYGTFVLRPLVLESVTWDYLALGETRGRINIQAADGWARARDLAIWTRWVSESRDEDFLSDEPVPVMAGAQA
jgi:hypothetical protein